MGCIIAFPSSDIPHTMLTPYRCLYPSSDIPHTMLTLFQLFTLDQWYNIYRDLIKISDPAASLIYILVWIGIGSFVFRNLFVGIMGEWVVCIRLLPSFFVYTYTTTVKPPNKGHASTVKPPNKGHAGTVKPLNKGHAILSFKL